MIASAPLPVFIFRDIERRRAAEEDWKIVCLAERLEHVIECWPFTPHAMPCPDHHSGAVKDWPPTVDVLLHLRLVVALSDYHHLRRKAQMLQRVDELSVVLGSGEDDVGESLRLNARHDPLEAGREAGFQVRGAWRLGCSPLHGQQHRLPCPL